MAGLDSSIYSNLQAPKAMSLSDIMGLATSAQAYKQAQQINPLAVRKQEAETNVSEQTAEPRISGAKSTASKLQIEAEQAGIDFKQHVSNAGAGLFGGFVTDPDFVQGNGPAMIKKLQGAKTYAKDVLGLPDDIVNNSDHLIELATTDPKQAYQTIKNRVTASQAAQTQQSLVTPQASSNIYGQATGVNAATGEMGTLGGGNTNVNPKSTLGTYSTDVYGNKVFIPNTPQGGVGTPQVPGSNPQANQPSPQMAIPPGETPDTMKYVTDLRNKSNFNAGTVRVQQDNANQIIKLADETNTGVGASILKNLGGGFAGIPWTSDSATNFNKLGHYIASTSIQLAQQAGLGTDSGRDLQAQASGSTEFTKDSLKSVARTNRALSSGVDLFNRGLENSVQRTGSPFAARDFQNQWSQTADVNSLRLYDALNNHDNAAIRDVVKSVGGTKSQGYKDLTARMAKMKQLIQGQ